MRLDELVDSEGMSYAEYDHYGEEYEVAGNALTISFRGQYTTLEIGYKLKLLQEAIKLYMAHGV